MWSKFTFAAVFVAFGLVSVSFAGGRMQIDANGRLVLSGSSASGFTEEQKQNLRWLKSLPTEEAIQQLKWFVVYVEHEPSRRFARDMFLEVPGWEEFFSCRLAAAASAPTPAQVFGEGFEKRRLAGELSRKELDAYIPVYERVAQARYEFRELYRVLTALRTPKAVVIVAPYLFHDSETVWGASSQRLVSVSEITTHALAQMHLESAPDWNVNEGESEAAYTEKWQRWWRRTEEEISRHGESVIKFRSSLEVRNKTAAGSLPVFPQRIVPIYILSFVGAAIVTVAVFWILRRNGTNSRED